jgi:hypothetical protein
MLTANQLTFFTCLVVSVGVPFTMQTPNDTILLTSGKLMASVCWAVDDQDKALAPPVVGSQNRFYGLVVLLAGFRNSL